MLCRLDQFKVHSADKSTKPAVDQFDFTAFRPAFQEYPDRLAQLLRGRFDFDEVRVIAEALEIGGDVSAAEVFDDERGLRCSLSFQVPGTSKARQLLYRPPELVCRLPRIEIVSGSLAAPLFQAPLPTTIDEAAYACHLCEVKTDDVGAAKEIYRSAIN